MKFRKKPVVIEAMKVPRLVVAENSDPFVQFMGGMSTLNIDWTRNWRTGVVKVVTLEGTMTAHIGDWIVRGVKGELYPVKPDIFEATYEPEGV